MVTVFTTAIALINEKGIQTIAVVGKVESGKTHSLQKIVEILELNQLQYKAILQPRILDENGKTIGYKLLLLPKNEELSFANKKTKKKGYDFNKSAFYHAKNYLNPPQNVSIVDEFGKLELEGKGHFKSVFSLKTLRLLELYGKL